MYNDKNLQKAVLAVMLGKKEEIEEAKKPLHPNQQKIDVHEPEKDEITAKDFEMLRKGKRVKNEDVEVEEVEQLDEVGDTEAGKQALGSYVKKRTKQLPQIEVGYQMAEPGRQEKMLKKYKTKISKGIGRAVDRLSGAKKYGKANEEVEELEELDKGPLGIAGRYVAKASKQVRMANANRHNVSYQAQADGGDADAEYAEKNWKEKTALINRRNKGIKSALSRIHREEVELEEEVEELDELRDTTLRSYERKAMDQRSKARTAYRSEINRAQSDGDDPNQDYLDSKKKIFSKRSKGVNAVRRRMNNEEVELDEMGPGRNDPKAGERQTSDQLMKDFLARGGQVKQGKSPKNPKNTGRMVAGGTLIRRERTLTPSGGKSYTAKMEEIEFDDVDETITFHDDFQVPMKEDYLFGDYLTAAKSVVGEELAVELANYAFKEQDETLFLEAFMRSDIEDKVKAHQKAGHTVTLPKYSTKGGQPHAEYVVTDKDSGVRRKYIHHGTMRRVENMGTAGKRD